MSSNTLLIIATLAGVLLFVGLLYWRAKNQDAEVAQRDKMTMDSLFDAVKYELADLVKGDTFAGIPDAEFEAAFKRKIRIQRAMEDCVYGIDSAKAIVIELIKSIIVDKLPTEEDILSVKDFKATYMEPSLKFEILMYFYKKEHGKDALSYMIGKYNLDREKKDEGQRHPSYFITTDEIDQVYRQEAFELEYVHMVDILAILIFQRYKGFGIIDTIREMNINGLNCGTSGSILGNILGRDKKVMEAPRSVWIYFDGRYIHLRFLTFGSEEELRRVVQLICRYNNPGPLTEKRGYLVNTMYDKSRVLALRPPASEYWAVFIRKFTLNSNKTENLLIRNLVDRSPVSQETMNRLLAGEIIKGYTARGDIPFNLIRFLMMGQVTCGVTGRQGSGKTTFMTSMIEFIDPKYTIRILEMAPEMYLREIYSLRNILSVQETDTVTAAALQDALKKSDAAVSIVGEVATDIIAARMIQMAQIASIFTIFSHHANTAVDLVEGIRNSLVNAGGFSSSMLTAEQQVSSVIKVDIHMDYTTDGRRFIDRVSQIIPLAEGVPYPEYDPKDPHSMNRITREYYARQTDRKSFTTRDILRYNRATDTYETLDWFTTDLTKDILNGLPVSEVEEFKDFVSQNWGL